MNVGSYKKKTFVIYSNYFAAIVEIFSYYLYTNVYPRFTWKLKQKFSCFCMYNVDIVRCVRDMGKFP